MTKKLDFLLDKTELKNLVKRFPFELSGGENQRDSSCTIFN